MKSLFLKLLSSILMLLPSLFPLACDNKSSGVLMPIAGDNIQLTDTNAKQDTAQLLFEDLQVSVFGGWNFTFTPPPTGRNERAGFSFTYMIENKGEV